ncbi:hypothetical protein evm_004041 [Chilo suppressalis]|nr:hypothetical protein evm_004041 [Chilo suppressalis]
MEAATVQTKKGINKGKLKKTIKNVLCRPDPVFWPLISEDQKVLFEKALNKFKIDIPHFKKLHWKELKEIPKEKRPKPPKIDKVNGLLFGITECFHAVKSKDCAAVIVEASVNPRIIVQHVIEACIDLEIPIICVNDLRVACHKNFNIPTSCLGIKSDLLPELLNQVLEIAKNYKVPRKADQSSCKAELMETTPSVESIKGADCGVTLFPYLHRTDKKSRVFIPTGQKTNLTSNMQRFSGQDFIEFKEKLDTPVNKNSYMKMLVKRISNNPNRLQAKKSQLIKKQCKEKDTLL